MDTKRKIIRVAKRLFLEKGVDNTSIRNIADEARINVAALNYHFKSKENLFEIILEDLLSNSSYELPSILNASIPLEEKIRQYVNTYIDIILDNPGLPFFIISVLHRNPKRIASMKISQSLYNSEAFSRQLAEEAEKGNIKRVDPNHFFVNMLSLIVFPASVQQILMEKNQWEEHNFKQFIKERKAEVYHLLMASIRIDQ